MHCMICAMCIGCPQDQNRVRSIITQIQTFCDITYAVIV